MLYVDRDEPVSGRNYHHVSLCTPYVSPFVLPAYGTPPTSPWKSCDQPA